MSPEKGLKGGSSPSIRKRVALTLFAPVALVSIALFAEPSALTIFEFGADLGSDEAAEVTLTFDAQQQPKPVGRFGNTEVMTITRATLSINGERYQTLCRGVGSDRLGSIVDRRRLCGSIIQVNGASKGDGSSDGSRSKYPDIWAMRAFMVPSSTVITETLRSKQPRLVSVDLRVFDDLNLDLIQPGVVMTEAEALYPDLRNKLTIRVGDYITKTLTLNSAITITSELDSDNDGVRDAAPDVCPNTDIPELVPTSPRGLGKNRWALTGRSNRNFTQAPPASRRGLDFTTTDTRGCSCEQILDALPGRKRTQLRRGCTTGVMLKWVYSPP